MSNELDINIHIINFLFEIIKFYKYIYIFQIDKRGDRIYSMEKKM